MIAGREERVMQINPGGRLNTKDVMGRDGEIARYWHVLERQGLVISAERRIGKTHIVLKMRDECRSGYLPIYQDLESVHSIADPPPLDLRRRSTVLRHAARSQGSHRQVVGPAPGQDCRPRPADGQPHLAGSPFRRIRRPHPRRRRQEDHPDAVGRISAHAAQSPAKGGGRLGNPAPRSPACPAPCPC